MSPESITAPIPALKRSALQSKKRLFMNAIKAFPEAMKYSLLWPLRYCVAKLKQERQYHHMDTAVIMILAASTATVGGLVSPQATIDRILLLMPLLGAIITAGGAFLLNPAKETRNIVGGRCLFGLLLGGVGPSALSAFLKFMEWTNLEALSVRPAVLILTGSTICFISYVLSRPFCAGWYERADRVAERELDRLEKMTEGEDGKKKNVGGGK